MREIQPLFSLPRAVEIRWLGAQRRAMFTERVDAIADALAQHPGNVYVTINELHPGTAAKHGMPIDTVVTSPARGALTGNEDISRRLLLPCDSDPERPTGTAATEEQRALAFNQSERIQQTLCALGWPEQPAVVSTGNGACRYFACDLPTDHETDALLRAFYMCAAKKFSTPGVKFDTSVQNRGRVMRLPGSVNVKAGRLCELQSLPSSWRRSPVTLELLRATTEQWLTETGLSVTQSSGDGIARPEAQAKFIRRFTAYAESLGAIVTVLPPRADGKVLILTSPCLLHDDHDGGVGITADGVKCRQCFHNRCAMPWREWQAAVEARHGVRMELERKLIFSTASQTRNGAKTK